MKVGLPQEPFWHVSPLVQASPSLQAAPFVLAGVEQVPVAGSQVPATWHWSEAVQTTGLLPVQTPLWQVSVCVQALPSLHAVPLLAFGLEHWPVAVLQVPATWHWSEAVLPSLHAVPSILAGSEHAPVAGLQVPAVWH